MQQLNSLLQDRKVLSADVTRQRLSQHSQVGQIPCPAIKCILQVLLQSKKNLLLNLADRIFSKSVQQVILHFMGQGLQTSVDF